MGEYHQQWERYVKDTRVHQQGQYLKLVKGMGVADFQRSLKEFTAIPDKIISENAKKFKAAKEWLLKLQMDADLHNYLAKHQIRWQFNLSRHTMVGWLL